LQDSRLTQSPFSECSHYGAGCWRQRLSILQSTIGDTCRYQICCPLPATQPAIFGHRAASSRAACAGCSGSRHCGVAGRLDLELMGVERHQPGEQFRGGAPRDGTSCGYAMRGSLDTQEQPAIGSTVCAAAHRALLPSIRSPVANARALAPGAQFVSARHSEPPLSVWSARQCAVMQPAIVIHGHHRLCQRSHTRIKYR
jgi:hypothetical protein